MRRHFPSFNSLVFSLGWVACSWAACIWVTCSWVTSSHAVPLTESAVTSIPTASAAAATTGKEAPRSAAKSRTATTAAKSPPRAAQKPEQDDVLVQPSAAFVCPHTDTKAGATDCFLEAVEHLYTVCRHVKTIELLEFGFAKAEEDTNKFKSELCRRKQRASLPPYFEAALQEVQTTSSCEAARTLNDLYAVWNTSMAGLRQYPNETEAEYQQRIVVPYFAFAAYRQQISDALVRVARQPVQSCPALATFKP